MQLGTEDNGSGNAVITLETDGITITLTGVSEGVLSENDFLLG